MNSTLNKNDAEHDRLVGLAEQQLFEYLKDDDTMCDDCEVVALISTVADICKCDECYVAEAATNLIKLGRIRLEHEMPYGLRLLPNE